MPPPPPNIDINFAFSMGQAPSPAPPTRKRQRRAIHKTGISRLSDLEAWEYGDEEIHKADLIGLKSAVYDHFTSELVRHTRPVQTKDGVKQVPDYMEYVFTCKTHPEDHVIHRRREDTSRGTGNFHSSIAVCHKRHPPINHCGKPGPGLVAPRALFDGDVRPVPRGRIPWICALSSTYTYAMHLAILVMSCAYHYLPFARVLDKLFRLQVELLRPGTVVPDSSTISRTTQFVYQQQAHRVKTYFKDEINTIHLAIDGWTSPTAVAYLGLVVHWYAEGRLWRTVLEFIRLEQKHTGAYMAEKTAECLKRYGLEGMVRAICLDNAGANDRLVGDLTELLPGFLGSCPGLVALLIHFVQPQMRKRKAGKTGKPAKRRRTSSAQKAAEEPQDDADDNMEDVVARLEQMESSFVTGSSLPDDIDEARRIHDERIVSEVTAEGLQYACKQLGLTITDTMKAYAQGVLTKAGKLARKLHDTPTLQAKFELLIDASREQLQSLRRALAGRMPTRWNTDYECLLSLKELKPCVQMLTAQTENNLRDLTLEDEQWDLLDQLVRVLRIFKEATDLFSQSEVPLVHEVVPVFVCMRQRLERVRDDGGERLHPLIRAAAHSALLVYNKYMGLFTESEVYWIAIVMCPDRKLQWLRDNGCSESDIAQVYAMVVARFNSFNPSPPAPGDALDEGATLGDLNDQDDWIFKREPSATSKFQLGSIEGYLRTEPVSSEVIRLAGGPLRYWESQTSFKSYSSLARFAIDYLSAPASSVDVERAFSCGRLMNNHLQHQMLPDTFCAKMALQSWFETPLLRDVDEVAALLQDHVPKSVPVD
ncbi:hAT family dimerization protein [Ceratobasidium sp. AG-Ba]|nr:hAT family dimerization protein [Ceratobasidium sp. AG-Ba]